MGGYHHSAVTGNRTWTRVQVGTAGVVSGFPVKDVRNNNAILFPVQCIIGSSYHTPVHKRRS